MESKVISYDNYTINTNLEANQLVEIIKNLYAKNCNLIKELHELGIKYEQIERKCEELTHQVDLLQIDNANLQQLVEEQRKIMEDNEKKHRDLSEKVSRQNNEIVGLKKDNIKLTNDNKRLTNDNKRLTKECGELRKECGELRANNNRLETKIDKFIQKDHERELSLISGETISKYIKMITENILGMPSETKFVDILYNRIILNKEQQAIYDQIKQLMPLKVNEFIKKLCQIKQPRNDDFHNADEDLTITEIKKSTHEYIGLRHNNNIEYVTLIDYVIKELENKFGDTPFKPFNEYL